MIFGSLLKGIYLNPKYNSPKVKKDAEKRTVPIVKKSGNTDDSSFITSLAVSAATNSVLPGLIVGGSLAGATLGAVASTSDFSPSTTSYSSVNDDYDYSSVDTDFDLD